MPFSEEALKWAHGRGLRITQHNERFMEIRVPQICMNYRSDGKCSIHKDKPSVCAEFPMNMVDFWEQHGMDPAVSLSNGCGFKYVKDAS
jgi:Fe-S-cluster containining protein